MATKKTKSSKRGETSKRPPRVGPTSAASESTSAQMPESDPQKKPFTPEVLDRTAIAIPLLKELMAEDEEISKGSKSPRKLYRVIIDMHLEYPGGRDEARKRVIELVAEILAEKQSAWNIDPHQQGINLSKTALSNQYLFGVLDGRVIQELIKRDRAVEGTGPHRSRQSKRAIYRIWPDFKVKALLTKSISTVKADAALSSFATTGQQIVWAVMDSGIDATHPHFAKYDNLNLSGLPPLTHSDFTTLDGDSKGALIDKYGHGTHVAGIIAGEMTDKEGRIDAETRYRDEKGEIREFTDHPKLMSGMAPMCKLLSLKVLGDDGEGDVSNLIAAIEAIQRINGNGRYIRVQGVNMSVGYDFEPEWFACGQSPLCVEVDRLVKSGVVVVVAAGNSGYGWAQSMFRGAVSAGLGLTINDPGNAELAVTVGSTHREMPHIYGVSYFSSKGPTGDGRLKPDLVAPGEKIVSCASSWKKEDASDPDIAKAKANNKTRMIALNQKLTTWKTPKPKTKRDAANVVGKYKEDSGTSMAAPHVSGVIAAFLSVRREFIGRPEKVKEVFLSTATDLKRDRYFQGHGLVDLMRAIQSV
jgi:serine protease AprX